MEFFHITDLYQSVLLHPLLDHLSAIPMAEIRSHGRRSNSTCRVLGFPLGEYD